MSGQYENIKNLRRYLNLTQKEFIDLYLRDEEGKAYISVAALSNMESRGGRREKEIIARISENLKLKPSVFALENEDFFDFLSHTLTPIHPIKREKIAEKERNISQLVSKLTAYFADEMLIGNLRRGDKIETDRGLASRFGVGRSAIREALKVLEILGMLEIKPGDGSFIASNNTNFFMIPLAWTLFLSGKQTKSILELRNILEVKAAELAAGNASTKQRMRLHDISHRMYHAYIKKDFGGFLHEDLEFHACIAEASGNEIIYSMSQTIRNLMGKVSQSGMVAEGQLTDIYREHQSIYEAIISKDEQAEGGAMKLHMSNSLKRYQYR